MDHINRPVCRYIWLNLHSLQLYKFYDHYRRAKFVGDVINASVIPATSHS
jgi:hypothetical protein